MGTVYKAILERCVKVCIGLRFTPTKINLKLKKETHHVVMNLHADTEE